MLKVKMLMCSLSFILLFNSYDVSIVTPLNVLATDVVKDNDKEMIHKDKIGLTVSTIEMSYDKVKLEQLVKENEDKNNKLERKEYILTFYTSLESENSSAGPVTCQNKPLSAGGVANNVIPQNTKIYLEGYGQVVVNDRGSDKYFSSDNRLDVFIDREPGESDMQYSQRVRNYGVQKVQGYIVG